jgi:hypothetical protein
MFVHVFFQAFKTDIQKLPASLAGSLDLIPELLNVSRANARKKKRLYGQKSKRNQFQSNSFFKRLKLYFFYPNMPIFMTDQNDTYLSLA